MSFRYTASSSTPSTLSSRLCPTCRTQPVNPGFKHCSRACALSPAPTPSPTPSKTPSLRKQIKTCEHCNSAPATPGYRYCSPKCGHDAIKVEALAESMGNLQVRTREPCVIDGCNKLEWQPGSKYCGNQHRAQAVQQKLEPACLFCRKYPKMPRSAFCSASCSKTATQNAPGLLAVPSDDPSFTLVANQFKNEWKHTATPPAVRFVYRIVLTNQLKDPFENRRDSIERRYNFKSQGMLEANERRRWHGTRRECNVGDPGSGALTMCSSGTCYLCIIMRKSFDVAKCSFGCLFGKGIYTSGTSSKSDTYVTQVAPSKYRSMLMTRVLAGNATKFTVPDPTLVSAPPGYDAIRGVPGSGLLYDELIVYNNDQVRPFYLVIYDAEA